METWNLLIDSNRGVFVAQSFAANYNYLDHNIKADDLAILLEGPENEDYWETWEDVLNYCELTDQDGNKFTLHHDSDLWAVPVGFDWETLEDC